MPLVQYLSSPPVFSGVRVNRSLALCVCFVDRCLSFCPFGHCVVCSSIYGFLLPLWYLQALHIYIYMKIEPCSVRIRYFELTDVLFSLDGIWTPTVIHCSTNRLSLMFRALDHSATSAILTYRFNSRSVTLHIYICVCTTDVNEEENMCACVCVCVLMLMKMNKVWK